MSKAWRHAGTRSVACTIIRGGTSKGVFVREEQLPTNPAERDALLVALMGSPDPRQIDGLGGADPLTSKVAIVRAASRWGIDVEYESVEVAINERHVNRGIMCGNLAAGIASFAILEGLVPLRDPVTSVRILCRSNNKLVTARIPVNPALSSPMWDCRPGTTHDVTLSFESPAAAVTGTLLPTFEPVSRFVLGDSNWVRVSIVDAGTLYAFAEAASFGIAGDARPEELDANPRLRAQIEFLRHQVAGRINERLGACIPEIDARRVKIALVAPPGSSAPEADIVARVMNPAKVHKAYAVSGGICLAAAAAIEGTVVNEIVRLVESPATLRIAHPSGVMPLTLRFSKAPEGVVLLAAEIERQARVIMRGSAFVQLAADRAQPVLEEEFLSAPTEAERAMEEA